MRRSSEKQTPVVIADFLGRLEGTDIKADTNRSAQHCYLDSVIEDIRAADQETGNAGTKVLQKMRKTFMYLRPLQFAKSISEYLAFRREKVCAEFVLASIKFTLGASVVMQQPALTNFLLWAGDHLSISSGLYSYAKEAKVYQEGLFYYLINSVVVIQDVMAAELERFVVEEALDSETLEFCRVRGLCLEGVFF
ncbi:hypothetical protein GQ43DRAFT_483149 [Delitschia confertaspora ATCC 74209]|uniref:Uncharacterized protein n=1 Tax=Delitschia confertaspora ATCC 74209 TaxID=1513339 RepID=A0A9P4MT26_9PLEO|nr:hypothetical protein GQ43DRAFT_483149 [Delitschia confertaspora ATCC 74209]